MFKQFYIVNATRFILTNENQWISKSNKIATQWMKRVLDNSNCRLKVTSIKKR